ncbi:anti-sigma factor antagonist [Aeromicrobium sp.]|uniref:anti-sigma factor antagonist n=1 Tax=Aeromicrobium sp. TaxID=1871063 RepID=UPI0019A42708|nr:anti-sigma factor antagonist [Aeromicrobium sp.]MBC7630386.1 anti-sigma factor antagonist [Aeromicrobium sp.]
MTEAPLFTVAVQVNDGPTVVMLAGELDLHSAPLLHDALQQAVTTGAASVVVDMALVSFCDARGLGLLVAASNDLRESGRQLSVRSAPLSLRRLFQITALTDALHVEPATTADGLLTADLAAAAGLPLTRAVLDCALKLVVVMSQSVMAGADGVSITLPRDGRLRTVAASDDVVLQMDHDQYDTGQGPCLDAATHGDLFHSTDLESESRWPQFVPRARARGIESIMSTPLMAADHPLGALNVYSRAPEALASHEQQWATQFAQEASHVLVAANATSTATLTAASVGDQIHEALQSREVIALAQGVIMTRQNLSPDAAHRFLIGISRRTSKPLLGICQEVIRATASARRGSSQTLDRLDGTP